MPEKEELFSISKKLEFEGIFLKALPQEMIRLSLPLVKKYLENEILVLCRKFMNLEKNTYNGTIQIYSDYFSGKKDESLPYLGLSDKRSLLKGIILICEDSSISKDLKYPGGLLVEIQLQPDHISKLAAMAAGNREMRMYLDRKKTRKVTIANKKLDAEIEKIKEDEKNKTREKAKKYFSVIERHLKDITVNELKKFEKAQQPMLDMEILNFIKVEKEMGTDFKGKSISEVAKMLKNTWHMGDPV